MYYQNCVCKNVDPITAERGAGDQGGWDPVRPCHLGPGLSPVG